MYTPDKATEWKPSVRGAGDRGLKWKSSQGERARRMMGIDLRCWCLGTLQLTSLLGKGAHGAV